MIYSYLLIYWLVLAHECEVTYLCLLLLHKISSSADQGPVQCTQSLNVHSSEVVCAISQYVYVDSPSLFSIFYTHVSEL